MTAPQLTLYSKAKSFSKIKNRKRISTLAMLFSMVLKMLARAIRQENKYISNSGIPNLIILIVGTLWLVEKKGAKLYLQATIFWLYTSTSAKIKCPSRPKIY